MNCLENKKSNLNLLYLGTLKLELRSGDKAYSSDFVLLTFLNFFLIGLKQLKHSSNQLEYLIIHKRNGKNSPVL